MLEACQESTIIIHSFSTVKYLDYYFFKNICNAFGTDKLNLLSTGGTKHAKSWKLEQDLF